MNRLENQRSSPSSLRPLVSRPVALAVSLACVVVLGSSLGCSKKDAEAAASAAPAAESIGTSECGACGMVVREQPAPRAQVVYASGERAFFCSIGDLVHYLETPSPEGTPTEVYVEALTPYEDPKQPSTSEHRWIPAGSAHYVLDVEREGVMGKPALVYTSRDEAATAAARHGGRGLDYTELRRELTAEDSSHHH